MPTIGEIYGARMRLLIVAGSDASLRQVAPAIECAGVNVVASTPAALTTDLERLEPDMVLLSLSAVGLEAISTLRNNPLGAVVPIVLVGRGEHGITDTASAQAHYADDYVPSPVTLEAISGRTAAFLGAHITAPTQPGAPAQELWLAPNGDEPILAAIRTRLEAARVSDYYDILGVPRDASTENINTAAGQLRAALAPGNIPAHVAQQLAPELAELRSAVDDAHDVLSSPDLRARYTQHL